MLIKRVCKVFMIIAGKVEDTECDKYLIAECSEYERRRLETRGQSVFGVSSQYVRIVELANDFLLKFKHG